MFLFCVTLENISPYFFVSFLRIKAVSLNLLAHND